MAGLAEEVTTTTLTPTSSPNVARINDNSTTTNSPAATTTTTSAAAKRKQTSAMQPTPHGQDRSPNDQPVPKRHRQQLQDGHIPQGYKRCEYGQNRWGVCRGMAPATDKFFERWGPNAQHPNTFKSSCRGCVAKKTEMRIASQPPTVTTHRNGTTATSPTKCRLSKGAEEGGCGGAFQNNRLFDRYQSGRKAGDFRPSCRLCASLDKEKQARRAKIT